ncbi:hypothetical protein AB0G04_11540 [Actinoplanes sp. NPDC023801]|uniref:hypothetical protein n=1 Tax=Actinoplanes sp. NPDC023801 TaxID=3154595 RepID=UPI0033F98CE1
MAETSAQRRYRDDARLLAVIGAHLAGQLPPLTVRLPREAAEAAVRTWERDETDSPGDESGEQEYVRSFAATLALIGAEIQRTGAGKDGGHVVVTLDPASVAAAVFAHECATDGMLRSHPTGEATPLS